MKFMEYTVWQKTIENRKPAGGKTDPETPWDPLDDQVMRHTQTPIDTRRGSGSSGEPHTYPDIRTADIPPLLLLNFTSYM